MLGFQPSQTHKGVYIDGHERADVVDYRKLYLRKLEVLETTHAPPPRCSDDPVSVRQEEDEGKKQLVISFFMMKTHSILTMVKGGFGLKLESNLFAQRGKGKE